MTAPPPVTDPGGGTAARAPLVVAAVLAAVAGYVDAIGFDRVFDVFPANQSGNAVLLGIGIGKGVGADAWRPALAIVGFVVGVALAIRYGPRLGRRRPLGVLGLELVLLVPVTSVVASTTNPAGVDDVALAGLVLATSCAMGLQTEVIRRVAGVAVATTYQSGAIAQIAELAGGARRDRSPARAVGLAVLAVVLVAYVGGAAGGAATGDWRGSMFVALATLVVLAAASTRPGTFGADG